MKTQQPARTTEKTSGALWRLERRTATLPRGRDGWPGGFSEDAANLAGLPAIPNATNQNQNRKTEANK